MKAGVKSGNTVKNILIIDDDKELAKGMEEFLLDEGYQVETAFNGTNGLNKIEKKSYYAILLDIKIPGIPAFVIVRKTKEVHAECKIFLISGAPYVEQTIKEEKLEDLIQGIFTKPFNIERLLASL